MNSGQRPRGAILIAFVFGLHSVVSSGLVVWALRSLPTDPRIEFVILDLLIIGASGLIAFGAWRLAAWTRNVFVLWSAFMLLSLWTHILASGFGIPNQTLLAGAVGTVLSIALSLWIYRYLRDLARPAA